MIRINDAQPVGSMNDMAPVVSYNLTAKGLDSYHMDLAEAGARGDVESAIKIMQAKGLTMAQATMVYTKARRKAVYGTYE